MEPTGNGWAACPTPVDNTATFSVRRPIMNRVEAAARTGCVLAQTPAGAVVEMVTIRDPFGTELRRWRLNAGLSLAALARSVHYSKSHLSKVETGAKRASVDLARRCDSLLGARGALAGLVRMPVAEVSVPVCGPAGEIWTMSLAPDGQCSFDAADALAPIRGRHFGGGLVVPAFRAMFDQIRRSGQASGPATLVPVLVAYTHVLRTAARHAGRPPERDRALRLAARFAEYTGWLVQEAGDDRGALWWTDRAVEFARAAGDTDLAGYAFVRRANVTLYRHDPLETVALARRAQAVQYAPRVRGLAAQREAQGHAIAGDYGQCRRALDRAAELLAAAAARHSDDQPMIGTTTVRDPVAVAAGWCLHDLGRCREAAEILERELAFIPPQALRSRARFGARLALALAAAGEVERACLAARPVIDAMSFVDSATIRLDLRDLARSLNRRRTHPAARTVIPDLTAALHTGMDPAPR